MNGSGGSVRWLRRTLALAVAVMVAGACSVIGLGGTEEEGPDAPVEVSVKNYNWATVHVYAYGGGQRASLGMLSTNEESTWRVPASLVSTHRQLRLIADPIGSSDSHTSEPIMFEPGDRIEWTLQNSLVQSSVMVR